MTETTEIPAATAATPFKGCFATYGLHKDYLKPEERDEAFEVLMTQVQVFKDKHPGASWAVEATYEFTWQHDEHGTVHRLEWEGVENRFKSETPIDIAMGAEQAESEQGEVAVTEGT